MAIELYFTLDIDTRQGGLWRFWRSCSLYFSLLRNTDLTVQRLLTPCFLTRCGSTPELWLICPSWAVDCQLKFRFDEDGGFWRLTGGSGTVNGSAIASVDKMATGMITWKMDRCPRLTEMIVLKIFVSSNPPIKLTSWFEIFSSEICDTSDQASHQTLVTVCSREEFTCSDGDPFLYRNLSSAKSAFCVPWSPIPMMCFDKIKPVDVDFEWNGG